MEILTGGILIAAGLSFPLQTEIKLITLSEVRLVTKKEKKTVQTKLNDQLTDFFSPQVCRNKN